MEVDPYVMVDYCGNQITLDSGKNEGDEQQDVVAETSSNSKQAKSTLKYDVDPNALDCPICKKLLSPPVYQCREGHIACADCCENLTNDRCPSGCNYKFDRIRCRAVENILETMKVSCKNATYGCPEMINFTHRNNHEQDLCLYKPIQCPYPGCSFEGTSSAIRFHLDFRHEFQSVKFSGKEGIEFVVKPSEMFVKLEAKSDMEHIFLLQRQETSSGDNIFFCYSFGLCDVKKYNLIVRYENDSQYYGMHGKFCRFSGGKVDEIKRDVVKVPKQNESVFKHFDVHFKLLKESTGCKSGMVISYPLGALGLIGLMSLWSFCCTAPGCKLPTYMAEY